MYSKRGITTRLAIVVKKTALETDSASLLYLVARIDDIAAAGIAEPSITTDLNTPVIFRRLTAKIPISKPTPIRKKEASNVVGSDVILMRERL